MRFVQAKCSSDCGSAIALTFFEDLCVLAARKAQVLPRDCQIGAGRQAYKIQGVRGGPGFIEVVHAPNQAAFLVPPRPEILDVQVADGENGGSTSRGRGRLPAKAESSGRKWRERKGREIR